jgi:hypothetical protein
MSGWASGALMSAKNRTAIIACGLAGTLCALNNSRSCAHPCYHHSPQCGAFVVRSLAALNFALLCEGGNGRRSGVVRRFANGGERSEWWYGGQRRAACGASCWSVASITLICAAPDLLPISTQAITISAASTSSHETCSRNSIAAARIVRNGCSS